MQLHDLMAKLFELRQVAADQAKDGPSGSGAMARALTAYEWLGDNIEAFVAGLDPEMTEGTASQTEGMGGDAQEPLPCPFCGSPAKLIHPMGNWIGREDGYAPNGSRYVCSALYETPSRECNTFGVPHGPNQDAEALVRWNTRAELTPPETAEVVPVAGGDMNACPICKGHSKFDECSCHYAASKTVHLVPETTRLREDLGQVTRERDDAVKALETAREALKPFSDYADPLRTAYPDDMPMTKGSAIAARQVTAGDFRRAREAYHAAARSASSQGGE